jgi:transposase
MLRMSCSGTRAFWTVPMWQASARKRGLPYRPQTKGKVEKGVKYVRGNFWPGLHFRDLDDLNAQALAWLNTTANRASCMAPPVRCRLRGCARRDYNQQTRR